MRSKSSARNAANGNAQSYNLQNEVEELGEEGNAQSYNLQNEVEELGEECCQRQRAELQPPE